MVWGRFLLCFSCGFDAGMEGVLRVFVLSPFEWVKNLGCAVSFFHHRRGHVFRRTIVIPTSTALVLSRVAFGFFVPSLRNQGRNPTPGLIFVRVLPLEANPGRSKPPVLCGYHPCPVPTARRDFDPSLLPRPACPLFVSYDKHVTPNERVTDFRTFVSGVKANHLKGGLRLRQCQEEVAAILKDRVLVGHALQNDLKVHTPRDVCVNIMFLWKIKLFLCPWIAALREVV